MNIRRVGTIDPASAPFRWRPALAESMKQSEQMDAAATGTPRPNKAANTHVPPVVNGLRDLLEQQVLDRPDASALVVTGGRVRISYAQLAVLVDDVAAFLDGTGLGRGDVVGVVCANDVDFVVALLGVARAGLVVAPLDPALPPSEMSDRLGRLGAEAVLVGRPADDAAPLVKLPPRTWSVRTHVASNGDPTVTLQQVGNAARRPPGATCELADGDALVLFTSGTTDRAKMVPLTHANVAASVEGICRTYELGPEDATVAVMPLFHGHGLFATLLSSLASGGCVLLPKRGRFSAHTFWDDVCAVDATWFTAVPTIHQILLQRSDYGYLSSPEVSFRFIRSCSAPLETVTAVAIERMFGAPVLSAYGMTETAHQVTSQPLPVRGTVKHGSVGLATGAELRVVGPYGRTCPAGSVGEVWAFGPTVARGYLADPAATADDFINGWFRTGDLGAVDEDGYLFLAGRIKNIINRGGEKISPEHVEAVLAESTGVIEAAVFAIPDPVYGERIGAAVVVVEGGNVTPAAILQEGRNRLAPFEVPDRLVVVAALPHTAKGALDRRAVTAQYAN